MPSILSVISAPRRTNRQSLLAATFFALQVTLMVVLLSVVYSVLQARGATWAVISAILVLYPGVRQSFSAALLRIGANLLGGMIGFAIGSYFGTGLGPVVLALVAVIFAGELLRMDVALRTACVAAIIVMNANDHDIRLSAVERIIAVLAGCGVAILMQLLARPVSRRLPYLAQTGQAPSLIQSASAG